MMGVVTLEWRRRRRRTEFADEDFWQGLGMGSGAVDPVEAGIPEAKKTAAQLREEEEVSVCTHEPERANACLHVCVSW